jgi:hypothetical protein
MHWLADRSTQFHHCLVKVAGPRQAEKFLSELPDLGTDEISPGNAAEDALDISIHNCDALAKADTGNCRGSVRPDAGKVAQLCGSVRKLSGVLRNYFCGRAAQHSGAAVIT